ncbi:uncharacterized protein LOC114243195 [Bombyx mandarina]|uniref:Uncharacterized protein LOC114243195 n=1 Tax=Bombyx mandarina TaxID=7092 RepID=A0A6J2JL87_BOMMA|nr:uncharacterized protein LOC114243195 [Bombyx mandarina]
MANLENGTFKKLDVVVVGGDVLMNQIVLSGYRMSAEQYGFREGRSTVGAILRVRSLSDEAVSRGGVALAVSLDIANAFNTLPWNVIGGALERRGMPLYLRWLVGSYLGAMLVVCTGLRNIYMLLLNEESDWNRVINRKPENVGLVNEISMYEVREAVRSMKSGKSEGPDVRVHAWTTDAIFALRQVCEKHRDVHRNLHMVFVDLEKAYDRAPKAVLWWVLNEKGIPGKYVRLICAMYSRARMYVRTAAGNSDEFSVAVGLHQGSALSPYLFLLVMDALIGDTGRAPLVYAVC